MEVKLIKENEDGSAVFEFNMSEKEKEMLLINGIRTALLAGIEDSKEWHPDFNLVSKEIKND